MKPVKRLLPGLGAGVGMLILILDAKTAVAGAQAGVELCVRTVIPSLFPFFVLSAVLTASLTGRRVPILGPLGRLLGVPEGAESLLLVGALGGYPVGAQCVALARAAGTISREDGGRMLGFCSNAGPAFLFGMGTAVFGSPAIPAALWAVHLLSTLVVGAILPGKNRNPGRIRPAPPLSFSAAVGQSVKTMAGVCGWVVLFRVLLSFLDRWCLWLLPQAGQAAVYGILELTNGFAALRPLPLPGQKFLLCSAMLGWGGLCVAMQTGSVTACSDLGLGQYLPGKLLQGCLSVVLSAGVQHLLFSPEQCQRVPVSFLAVLTIPVVLCCLRRKKAVAIPAHV